METRELAPECLLSVQPGAVVVTPSEFEEAWAAMAKPHTFMGKQVHRRQQTFGARYAFVGDGGSPRPSAISSAPELVQACVPVARRCAAALGHPDWRPDFVHVNWYPGGTAGIASHQDDEPGLQSGAPICSFTFLGRDTAPRIFRIRRAKTGPALLDLTPGHGDMIVMHGSDFQSTLWHEVPKTVAAPARKGRRINVTIRAAAHAQ